MGAGLLSRLFWPRARRPVGPAFLGALLLAGGSMAGVALTLQQVSDEVDLRSVCDYLRETTSGQCILAVCAAAMVLSALELPLPLPRWMDRMAHGFATLTLVAGLAANSHAGAMFTSESWLDMRRGVAPYAVQVVHMGAVLLWGGPLLYLSWLPVRAERDRWKEAVRKFSAVALPCVCVFVATGAFLGFLHMGRLSDLYESPYGRLFVAKSVTVALLLGVAALNRWRTLPAVDGAGIRRLRANMQIETVLLLLVLSITTALASADPPHHHGAGVP